MDAATSGGHPIDVLGADLPHTAPSPTVLRIAFGDTLRKLREKAGVSREVASETIRGSVAKISRMETGRVGFKIRDVADLLVLYEVTDPGTCDDFLELAHQANKPGWWQTYSDVLPAWFETYLGLEQAASMIRTFELQFIPGLLQTQDYARAVTLLAHTRPEEVERRVQLRMRRQLILDRERPPVLWAVIDESALRRSVSHDPAVLRGQLEHLLRASERRTISIQIVPLDQGGHAAAGGSFNILRFGHSPLPDIVYIEHLTSAQYLDKPSDVKHYALVMSRLITTIEPPERTPSIIKSVLDGL